MILSEIKMSITECFRLSYHLSRSRFSSGGVIKKYYNYIAIYRKTLKSHHHN